MAKKKTVQINLQMQGDYKVSVKMKKIQKYLNSTSSSATTTAKNIANVAKPAATVTKNLTAIAKSASTASSSINSLGQSVLTFSNRLKGVSITAFGNGLKFAGSAASSMAGGMSRLGISTKTVATNFGMALANSNKFFNSFDQNAVDNTRKAIERFSGVAGTMFPKKGIVGSMPIVGGFAEGIGDVLDPGKISTALGYRIAYGIADMPIRAIQSVVQGVRNEIQEASSLEGELYDLEAYLGGINAQNFVDYTGIADTKSATTEALNVIQNKILSVGQTTTFTSLEIARALTEAAKAGVTIEELGKPGESGALDAIALLAQNTGEGLEKTAQITSKLQEAFRSNLDKSQKAFGQTANEAEQYMMVVNSLSQADAASAASASQLTEALFNVGGSANNINMSFFDTLSLVSAMVPAFESAASAGTSLKYVFSRITGANSLKAQENMKLMGLMDQYGQSVFFDEKGFKGMEFMVRKLRETFGDESGMAVDVRNKIITEIFGQDALKSVSRMVSMTEDQAEQVYQMASSMTEGARKGVNYAQQVADIKNEGLEYDVEYLKGSLDSLSKTLTVPLLKPMSKVVQTFSGFANGMFAILQGAGRESKQVKDAIQMLDTSILPSSMGLFEQALSYAETLKVGLDAIMKEGFNTSSIATAIAALLGTEKSLMSARVAEYKVVLEDIYKGIEYFIANLPALLTSLRDSIGWVFENLVAGFNFIRDNWQEIVFAMKAIAVVMLGNWVITSAQNWGALANSLYQVFNAAGKVKGLGNLALAMSEQPGLTGAVGSAVGNVLTMPKTANTWTNVGTSLNTFLLGSAAAGTKATSVFGRLGATLAFIFSKQGILVGGTAIVNGLTTALSFLLSPIGVLVVAIAGMAAAWYYNVGGIKEWMTKEFGDMYEYVSLSVQQMAASFVSAWQALSTWLWSEGGYDILTGFANMVKGITSIISGLVTIIGGILKIVVGIITFNGQLIGTGLFDIFGGVVNAIFGVMSAFIGNIQGVLNVVANVINKASRYVGGGNVIDVQGMNEWLNNFVNTTTTGATSGVTAFTKGVAKGAKNGQSDVREAGSGIGDELNAGFRASLDIKSPSGVGMIGGENFVTGVAKGIYNGVPVIRAAAQSLSSALTYSFSDQWTNDLSRFVSNFEQQIKNKTLFVDAAKQGIYGSFSVSGSKTAVDKFNQAVAAKNAVISEKNIESNFTKGITYKRTPLGTDVLPLTTTTTPVSSYMPPQYISDVKSPRTSAGEVASRQNVKDSEKRNQRTVDILSNRYMSGAEIAARANYANAFVTERVNEQIIKEVQDAKYYPEKNWAGTLISKIVDVDGVIKQSNDQYKIIINEEKKANFINTQSQRILDKQFEQAKWQSKFLQDQEKTRKSTEDNLAKNKVKYGPSTGAMVAASGGAYQVTTSKIMADPGNGYMYIGNGIYVPTGKNLTTYKEIIKYRPKTTDELGAMKGFDYLPLTQVPVGAMRGDFANLPLDQYSTPEFDVSQRVKTFQFATGDRAVEQRGLTDMFQNEDISGQYANIGNRAATYLSLRQGQLKPNEIPIFQDLLRKDRADRIAYLNAVQNTKKLIAEGGDATTLIQQLISSNQGQTQTFKDVFDVKIPSLGQYTADMGGSFDQYAKLGPQLFNEAFSVAVNPENQSAAFKALTPEAQDALKKSVQDMPSQAMAFLGSAMADGTLDSDEFDTYMQYVGEDINRMREIILRGTPPTQEELDQTWNPFIDGTAKLVKSDQITGVLGQSLISASKVIYQSMGAEARDAFIKGWTTNDKGEKIQLSGMTLSDMLGFDPESIKTAGIPVGTILGQGISKGVQDTLVTESSVISQVLGPDGEVISQMETETEKGSPSKLYYREIGIPIGMGIAEGIIDPAVIATFAANTMILLSTTSSEQYKVLVMQQASLYGQEIGKYIASGIYTLLMGKGTDKSLGLGEQLLQVYTDTRTIYDPKIINQYEALGTRMAMGVADGFRNNATRLISNALAATVVDGAIKEATLMLKIKSPSRVFADEIGSPMAEGVAMGISNSASSVSDALNPLLTSAAYRPDISSAAINGMISRSQMAAVSSSVQNNYNLSLATTYPGQTVQQQFEIMRAFKGRK